MNTIQVGGDELFNTNLRSRWAKHFVNAGYLICIIINVLPLSPYTFVEKDSHLILDISAIGLYLRGPASIMLLLSMSIKSCHGLDASFDASYSVEARFDTHFP